MLWCDGCLWDRGVVVANGPPAWGGCGCKPLRCTLLRRTLLHLGVMRRPVALARGGVLC